MIRRLTAAGWTVVNKQVALGMDLPVGLGFDTVDMERRVGNTDMGLTVQVFDDGVLSDIACEGARDACHLTE